MPELKEGHTWVGRLQITYNDMIHFHCIAEELEDLKVQRLAEGYPEDMAVLDRWLDSIYRIIDIVEG
jgi:hypothetical protein